MILGLDAGNLVNERQQEIAAESFKTIFGSEPLANNFI